MILLSIVVPVYQRQDGLDNLIDQLNHAIDVNNAQSIVELIVVDDGSEKIVSVSNNFPYVNLMRNTCNLGAPLSREAGFKLISGMFVHFHDSDDSIEANWLESLLSCLKENSELDVLLSGRIDINKLDSNFRFQKYFHRHHNNIEKISNRLVYRNCLGPLGGVTFSRRVINKIEFKNFASCQDWQMYLEALNHSEVLISRPDIHFIFNKTGDDRISHNPRKKILGHLQLAKITAKKSVFGRNIRLFYLYTCKQHIFNKGGSILKLYKKNRLSIFATFLIVSVYWRLT